ncbi:MAG: ABC transporter ATP-binding protein [Planctomycetaceae bacterium]
MGAPRHRHPEEGSRVHRQVTRRLFALVTPHRGLLAGAVAVLVALSLAEITGLWTIRQGINEGVRGGKPEALLLWVGIFGAVSLFGAGMEYLKNQLTILLGQRVIYDVRTRLFARIHTLPQRFFDRMPVGTLVTRVTSDVEAVAEMFSSGIAAVFYDILKLIVVVGVLFWFDSTLALVALAALPVVVTVSATFGLRMRKAYREVRARLSRLNGFQQEAFTGIPVTRLARRESTMEDRFAGENHAYRDSNIRAVSLFALFFPVIEFLGTLAMAAVLVAGAGRITEQAISWGDFFFFWLALALFFEPLRDLAEKFNVLQAALAGAERIFALSDEPPEEADPPGALAPARLRGEVEFRDVHLAYVDGVPALRGVSLRARPGETIALVGPTGAGKTSIIALLSRLWDPTAGEILVDGVPARRYARRALRGRIAVVMQDVFLFTGTIEENLRMGDASLSSAAIRSACETVRASRFIEGKAGGYQAPVHERGGNLSVGEKQLLAFARALAAGPDILILDEATSSIDTETEHLIQEALPRLLKGRTSLVIAHRLSTIRQADRIVVLHHGRVVEEGNHESLLAGGGLYARLHALSYGAE